MKVGLRDDGEGVGDGDADTVAVTGVLEEGEGAAVVVALGVVAGVAGVGGGAGATGGGLGDVALERAERVAFDGLGAAGLGKGQRLVVLLAVAVDLHGERGPAGGVPTTVLVTVTSPSTERGCQLGPSPPAGPDTLR